MKIAIVGCGQRADAHIQEAQKIAGVQVAAVCDANRHMAEQAAVRFGVPGVYTELGSLLREAKADVVHITTPPASHASIAKAALEHGAHVYVEKPFTVDATEAEELAAVSERTGGLVCVGHSHPFERAYLRLKEAWQQGELGDVVHVDAVMGYDLSGAYGSVFMGDPTHWVHRLPGGLAQNNISHPLSLTLDFLPDDPLTIEAWGFRRRTERFGDVRDELVDELRVMFAGRTATAHLLFSCWARPVQLCVTVYGTKRQASVSLDSRTVRMVEGAHLPGPFAKVQWARREAKQARSEYRRSLRDLVYSRLHYFEGMQELMRRFYDAIAGKAPMPIPIADAVRMTRIMDEIFSRSRRDLPATVKAEVSA